MSRRTGSLVVVAGLALVACGGDGGGGRDGGAALGDDPTFEECGDAIVAASQAFDTTGIDPADGFDDAEFELIDDRAAALEADHPVLVDGSACDEVLDAASAGDVQAMIDRIDPTVLAIISAPRPVPFAETEETIN